MSRKSRRVKAVKSTGNRALKWVLITGTTLLLLLFVALFGFKLWLKSYLRSDEFRNTVVARVADLLKSEIELTSFNWADSSVYADGFRAHGYEDAAHAHLQLDGLRIGFAGIADQAWQLPETTLNRLNLEFSGDRLPGLYADRIIDAAAAAAASAGPDLPDWLKGYVPDRFEIGNVRIDAANLRSLDESGAETIALRSVQTWLRPMPGGSGWDIDGQRGKLVLSGQPEMDIDRFRIRWRGRELFINDAAVDIFEDTRINGNGTIVFPESGGSELDLKLDFANLDLDRLTGPEWENKLSGLLSGEIDLKGKPGSPEGLRQSGKIRLKEGVLQNLPVLDKITHYTRDQRFKILNLSEATAEFDRQGGTIIIRKIAIERNGLTRLEGDLTIEGDNLLGKLQLGVTPGTLKWIPGAERKIFKKPDRGFLWTDVTLAGSLSNPREDLSARLKVAAGTAIVEEIPQKALDAARKSLNDPVNAPATVIDEGRKFLDTLVPLLPVP